MSQGETLDLELTAVHSSPVVEPIPSLVNGSKLLACSLETQCHQLFEAQAKNTPNAVAVVFEDQQLTYQQLNQKANQLAYYLRSAGVGLETFVGLYSERSLEMIIGLLGILKAGGTYVPLDPSYPSDRLAFILQDTQASVILTQAALADSLPPHCAQVICLDADWNLISENPLEDPICVANANSLMYTIYTSGSTGKPKGVMIAHSSTCNQLYWRQSTFPLSAADRVLQNISLSFDPSVWQIFWPLCFGAQLVLPRPGGQQDVAYLVRLIAEQQISVIALVPSLLRVFLEAKGLDKCQALKHVFCGGEALTLDLQKRFFERFDSTVLLHNVYGPTEATIDATYWTCDRNHLYPVAPIGKPILNAQVYVLNNQLQPLPPGEAGELHIGGAGLARGYLNRPELTAEKFIANPFSTTPSERLYKTGDLVCRLPDGNLEFLGRIDHQVKVRGFRIELGEIEVALNEHPGVQQSVVTAWESTVGDKRLAAYFVSNQSSPPSASELRDWLQAKLPHYMVPAAFVQLEAFPLNPNGKVDRRALPTPDVEHAAVEGTWVAPQTALEQQLVAIWEQVLQVQPIGVQDNFFHLGGNSLLATTLFTELEKVLGRELPLYLLFERPTIKQFADFLQGQEQTEPVRSLIKIQTGQAKPPLFCMHTRTGHVYEYYGLAKHLDPEQPVYALQAPLFKGRVAAEKSLEQMAADYLQEIRSIQPNGPYFLCGYSFGGLLAYEVARQLTAQDQTVALLVLIDTYNTNQLWFSPLPFHGRLALHFRTLRSLSFRGRMGYLWRRVRREVEANAAQIEANANTQHFEQIAQNYRPQPYDGKAVLIQASHQPTQRGLKLNLTDAQLGWGDLIKGGLEIHALPCDHFSMMQEPILPLVAAKLQASLQASQP
ncbi:MAG TPA: amino acid adenylation domain-containing protein [Leptolyngbyaceae cyanobacterium]